MSELSDQLITYCTNIHPSDDWHQTLLALQWHIPEIKAKVSPERDFPIGLRLSQQAALQLEGDKAQSRRFINWMKQHNCFVPTLNGFSYGSFHQERIKEQVYLPDWRSPERVKYTISLANLLAEWLPPGLQGSISTVPIGFKANLNWQDLPLIKRQLTSVLEHLIQLKNSRGKEIILALEPEPACFLETTEEVCRFFEVLALPAELQAVIGICYDCCHQAVEFEDPADSLKLLSDAGIRIAKVQVSSALSLLDPSPTLLDQFDEPRYLHQVVIKARNGKISRYLDLSVAQAEHVRVSGDEWRCHFHVPIFIDQMSEYRTTRSFLEKILPLLAKSQLLEVETYTWDVLPAELRTGSVSDSIVRELKWLESRLCETMRCH